MPKNSALLQAVPANPNYIQATKYIFVLPALTTTPYFATKVLFPTVSTNAAIQENPRARIYRHGDRLEYGPLEITFIVDEDLRSYEQSYDWLRSLTSPHDPDKEYRLHQKKSLYYDGMLQLNTNSNNTNIRIKFTNCHPISLSGMEFATDVDANTILTASLTLRFDTFLIDRLD